MSEDEPGPPTPEVEEPSLDELSQVRVSVNEDGTNLQEMVSNIQQKYSSMLQQLESIKESDDIELSEEKEAFLDGTIEQVRGLLQRVGGGNL